MAGVLDPSTGRLLVANPQLPDPNFDRTVVLLLNHGLDGSLGIVLNRPGGEDVVDRFPAWTNLVGAPAVFFEGGPVQPGALIGVMVRSHPAGGPGDPELLTEVLPDVDVVDLERLDAGTVPAGGSSLRLFSGYAGWSPGQLEGEISAGGWWVVDARPGDVTTPDPDLLWRRVLRRQKGSLSIVASYPADPTLN